MTTLGLVNIGALATGVLEAPRLDADAILVVDGRIAALGAGALPAARDADVVVDCRGTTVIPGLIDSHCHVVLGDYTPRQKTVDFLDSYVHGRPADLLVCDAPNRRLDARRVFRARARRPARHLVRDHGRRRARRSQPQHAAGVTPRDDPWRRSQLGRPLTGISDA